MNKRHQAKVLEFVEGELAFNPVTPDRWSDLETLFWEHGARIIEAYPIDIHTNYIEYERYSGLTTTYEKEGFKEVCRRSERRPIMRYYVEEL